jgi:AbrB family looped-hinge helix DNA binding protein
MARTKSVVEVRLDKQGRLVIPVGLRRALDLRPGDRLIARAEGKRIVFERKEEVLARVKRRFAVIPPEVDLAEELIAERRAEAQREA